MTRAIILFGHGSRDPLWRKPMEAVAARVAADAPDALVRCAYLELDRPLLPDAVRELAAAGATHFTVLPMFLGVGRHARDDLPALVADLRTEFPQTAFDIRPAVGEDPQVLDLLARLALG